MLIQQFEDKGLAHFSYVVISDGEAALIDPGRNTEPYFTFIKENGARITAVLETHSHADFISGHMDIARKTGATVWVSEAMDASFIHSDLKDGDLLPLGSVTFRILATPGHSLDSICFLLLDADEKEYALFSGDTLLIGDVGRPDLRETYGVEGSGTEELAAAMFDTIQHKLRPLPDNVLVYPAHGAGTLCGKSVKDAASSTMGTEKKENYAFLTRDKDAFITAITSEQPVAPFYFPRCILLNETGPIGLEESIAYISRRKNNFNAGEGVLIIDARPNEQFRASHIRGSINLPDSLKFETWVGSILKPGEQFYLIAGDAEAGERLIRKIAKIGYEFNVQAIVQGLSEGRYSYDAELPSDLTDHPERYTIIDARNPNEYAGGALFPNALNIPLPELRFRAEEIPLDKPLAVHCAAGYRSAIATSILHSRLRRTVYDIGNAIASKQ